jgi:hypothetical protein
MYKARSLLSDPHDLNQGDILRSVLRPHTVIDRNFVLRDRGKVHPQVPPEALVQPDPNLRVMHGVDKEDLSMVISNSCDNASDLQLLLAAIRPFEFPNGCDTREAQWRVISEAATGTANPKFFYLPASTEFGLLRSEVRLTQIFPVTHSYLNRCLTDGGLTRACGLTEDAQRHLQWTIALFFGRNPREDNEWPSLEDFALKEKWLEAEVKRGTRYQKKYEAELAELKARHGR